MPIVTFDDIIEDKKESALPKVVTFEDIDTKPKIKPLETEGVIRESRFLPQLIGQAKRKGLTFGRGLLEDIPFARKLLPKEQPFEEKGLTKGEKILKGVTPVARDIGLYATGAGLVEKAARLPKIAKAGQVLSRFPGGRLLAKSIPEAAKGALLGGATAGAEDPKTIAKKAGQFGAFTGLMPVAFKGLGAVGKGVARITPKPIKQFFVDIGKSLGTVLENNKATVLIRKRYADVMKGQLDSEQFTQEIEKVLTPQERRLIPFIRERALTKEARQAILRDPAIRGRYKTHLKPIADKIGGYLDDSHKFLMENYGDDVGFIENYIPHIWNIPKNKQREVVSWFVTRNPHLKQRLVPTIKEGIEKFGLKPKYDDITDIMRVYDQYKINAIANVKFAKDLSKMKDDTGMQMIQRVDKAPDDWRMVDHPALRRAMGFMVGEGEQKKLMLNKIPVKVHPEIYESVKAIFDRPISNQTIKNISSINSTAKYLNLSASLFHHTALTETGLATPGITKDVVKAWNPVRIIKAFKSGNYKTIFKNMPLSKDAVEHGLQLGRIVDVEGGNIIMNSLRTAERNLRGVKGNVLKRGLAKIGIGATKIRKPMELNNKFLWEYLHSTYKLTAYEKLSADLLRKNPRLPIDAVKNEAAQFVNDTFGGQVWALMAKSSNWQKFAHFALLSPDWTLSTVRQALSPFGVGATSPITRGLRAELGQDFWRRAMVYFGGSMNMLNYSMTKAFTGEGRFMWDNPPGKKTHLFIGYNPDGTEAYLRWGKQFRELPEFMINPTEVISRKISPIGRQIKAQLFPHPVWQREFAGKPFWKGEALAGRAKEIAKGFAPYSVSQQMRRGFNPLAFAMPISKGMTTYRARELFTDAIKRRDKPRIREIWAATLNNNLDAEKLFKQARTSIKSDITFDFKKDARKILERIRKLGKEKGQAELQRMVKEGEITPELNKQLIKILIQQKSIKRQQEQLRRLR